MVPPLSTFPTGPPTGCMGLSPSPTAIPSPHRRRGDGADDGLGAGRDFDPLDANRLVHPMRAGASAGKSGLLRARANKAWWPPWAGLELSAGSDP